MNETNVDLSGLPEGWVYTTLGEICESALKTQPKERPKVEFIYIDIASIDNHLSKIVNPKIYVGKEAPSRARQVVKTGDILFSTVRTYLKNIALVNNRYDGQIASTGFCIIRPLIASTEFIFWMTLSNGFLSPLNKIQRGTSYPAVRNSDVFSQIVPLPPENEQIRIVAKIEELFTKLDAGKEELLQAKARLKRYRQSVLKAAMDGKLTENWRKEHGGEIEPASVLLERILQERREQWEEEQLAKYKEQGKTPPKNWRNKYKEPQTPDTSKLSELPEGWVWMTLREVIQIIDYRGRTPPYSSKGIPHLRSANIKNGSIIWNDLKYVTEDTYDKFMTRGLPKQGDLLFTTEAPLGEVAFVPNKKFSLAQRIMILRPSKDIIKSGFLLYQIRAGSFQERLRISETGSVVTGISSRNFKPFPLIIPPLSEQQVIVSEVERRLSVANAVEAVVDAELKRSDTLRQSVLKQAFSGKLVPQDPNDEPAEKLLARIKKEKSKREAEQKAKRKTKKQLALFEH